ncbi:general transcription repressor, partial [Tieghemiomyces parasiticus]
AGNHIQELTAIQQSLNDLQRSHLTIKQKYEEEIARLQKELEMRGGPPAPGAAGAAPGSAHAPPPPAIGQGGSMLESVMGGPPGPANGVHPGYAAGYPNGAVTPQQHAKRLRSDTSESLHPTPGQVPPPVSGAGPYPANYAPGTPHDKSGKLGKPLTPTGAGPTPPQPHGTPTGKDGAVVPKRKTSGSSTVGPPGRSAGPAKQMVAVNSAPGAAPAAITDVDPNAVPSDLKVEGSDWFAIFNPKVPRALDMDLLYSLEHSSVVCCVRFSADGKYLATGCNRTAQIFDAEGCEPVITLNDESVSKEGDLYIRSVCFSPDGAYLATGAEDKLIRIWDIKARRIIHTLHGHEQDIYSLDYSADGKLIVSGSGDRTARLWDATTGQMLFSLATDDLGPKDAGVTSVAMSPDGRFVAAGSLDRMVRVWDAKTSAMIERLEGHKDSVYSVAFTPDGQSLVSGSLDKTIKIWDLAAIQRNASSGAANGSNPGTPKAGLCRATLAGHKDFVLSVACSPCGRWIVSGSKDRSVQFWDAHSTNTQFMLQGHKNSVISVSVSPQRGMFATGS